MSEENKMDTTEKVVGDKKVEDEVKTATEETCATADRDMLDGGFAVVDRESLIAEETKVKIPLYNNLANLFVAPSKTMEETIEADPIKGTGLGMFWSIVFAIICTLITFTNPLQKEFLYDTLRKAGTAEEKIGQVYQLQMISGSIGVIIGVIFAAFIMALGLQIIRAICRDKGSFKKLFIISLFSCVVAYALNSIDAALQLVVGTKTTVLGMGSFLGAEAVTNSILLQTLASTISVANIWSAIVLIVGYKVMTHKSMTKAVVVVLIYELIGVAITYGSLMLSQSAMQMMG